MIARLRVVRRAILFSSTEPAPWTLASFATPATRLYGFVHHREAAYTAITTSWDRMQFSGLVTTVDGASPPFGGSHRLETNLDTCRAVAVLDTFHNCVVVDAVTPLDGSGRPVFESVWTYLIGG